MDPDKAVLISAVLTLGSTVGATAAPEKWGGKGELPSPRLLIGTGLTFMGLSILADLAPSVAAPMSAAVALTAMMYYGIPVLDKAFNPQPERGSK